MSRPSIRRRLVLWVLVVMGAGAPLLLVAAYLITLSEIDEVLDDSLRQTALLLADRDLALAQPGHPGLGAPVPDDTESKLVALARRPDGSLMFSSQPELDLSFWPTPGSSVQRLGDVVWHVFTVVQADRTLQVAQPASVRREGAAEAASQLLLPLALLFALVGGLVVAALQRGLLPLQTTSEAIAQRGANSLAPLADAEVPVELLPMVRTLNDLLRRVSTVLDAQRSFIADAAHELRSPVTALQLQLQILEQSRDAAERAEASAALAAGIARTTRLIEQLLDLSRTLEESRIEHAGALPAVRLDEVVRRVVTGLDDAAVRRRIDLGAGIDGELTVAGHATQLENLVRNLVDNALKYTPPGGVVDVLVGHVDGRPALRVVDSGPGIVPAERQRVFDRFYRSPDAVARGDVGSGLGLAIVRAIADRHGAEVSLHAGRDGTGLEVRVLFPRGASR